MMYLSTALETGPHLRTVLAHEYTHAVTLSVKAFSGGAGGVAGRPHLEEEGWLDEALAHLVEDLHGFSRSNLDYRVSAFLSQPARYQRVVEDYYAADLFRSHGNRGGTYLFLRWCADRFGPALLPTLIRSDKRGIDNLEAATGVAFAELYRQWSVALYLSGLDPSAAGGHPGGYRSLDVRGPLERWELAGPPPPAVPALPPPRALPPRRPRRDRDRPDLRDHAPPPPRHARRPASSPARFRRRDGREGRRDRRRRPPGRRLGRDPPHPGRRRPSRRRRRS